MEIKFLNDNAEKEFLSLPEKKQTKFELDLRAIQSGSKPFSDTTYLTDSVGAGAIELRINGKPAYRCVYCAKFNDTIYILAVFKKTTNGVDRKTMALAKKRYSEMLGLVS